MEKDKTKKELAELTQDEQIFCHQSQGHGRPLLSRYIVASS